MPDSERVSSFSQTKSYKHFCPQTWHTPRPQPLSALAACPGLTLWQRYRPDANRGQPVGGGEGNEAAGVQV